MTATQGQTSATSTLSFSLLNMSQATLAPFQNGVMEELDGDFRSERFKARKAFLDEHCVGQEAAKIALLRGVERFENPLRDLTRPVGIVYLVGGSRNGKGLLVELISEIVHRNRERHLKINGGSYKDMQGPSRLVGSAPGLVGYHEGQKGTPGKLSNAAMKASRGDSTCPLTILFIDEADLLYQSLDDILMSIFDKGQLDMGNNEVADFRNTLIVLASNLGLAEALKRAPGFGSNHSTNKTHAEMSTAVLEAYERRYSLPWRNRVDDLVVMEPQTAEQIDAIVMMELEKFKARVRTVLSADRMFELGFDSSAKQFIYKLAMESEAQVAEIKRLTQRLIIDKLGPQLEKLAGHLVICTHKPGAKTLTFILAKRPDQGRLTDVVAPGQGARVETSHTALAVVQNGGNVTTSMQPDYATASGLAFGQVLLAMAFGFFLPFAVAGVKRAAAT